MSDAKVATKTKSYRIPDGTLWANAWKMTAVIAVIGIAVAIAGAMLQPERFGFSYLYAFITVLVLWFGSVFFVLIQHLTSAGWSVSVRRASEFMVSGIVVLPFLFVPVALNVSKIYPWWDAGHEGKSGVAEAQEAPPAGTITTHEGHEAPHGATHIGVDGLDHHSPHELLEEANMAEKRGYLNPVFFSVRALVYFAIWFWLGLTLWRRSVAQDTSRDMNLTNKLRGFSAPATFLYAMTLTFAVFDWVMSLEPGWYSTMFGVRLFASGAVTSFAAVIMITLGWKRAGLVGDEINTEHIHDLGKLMFGFLIFWAYVSFGEFLLIWYAAIPEETIYFHRRWDDQSWRMLSCAVVGLKFIFPFFFTLSRNVKRNMAMIAFGAAWILGSHVMEMYYCVMPYYQPFQPIQWGGVWIEAGCVMATLGVYLTYVLWKMNGYSLIAVGDPRLQRALNFVNQ